MNFRITGNHQASFREITSKTSTSSTQRSSGSQQFDQIQFSARLTGQEGKLQELTGKISQELRVRPTRNEINELRNQTKNGTYQIDIDKLAARMLLHSEVCT